MIRIKAWLWVLIFTVIFLLTQDYLFANWSEQLSLFGFPSWLWWFIGVHLLFVGVFYVFAKNYWKRS